MLELLDIIFEIPSALGEAKGMVDLRGMSTEESVISSPRILH